MHIRSMTTSAFSLLCALALPAAADDTKLRDSAKATLQQYGPTIVTVKVVLKRRYIAQGRERGSNETPMELSGTVLTPGGLTVVSDATTNPSALSPMAPDADSRVDTDTTDVKLVLKDGREIPARFVLRDQDLDLAFLLPDEKGLTLPYLDLKALAAPVPAPLDDLVFLFPMAKSLNRETGVALERVRAVSRKPRTFVASDMFLGMQSLGCPVFDASGKAVGLVVVRRAPRVGQPSGGFRDVFDAFTPVVLTAADVLDLADQALKQPAQAASPAPAASSSPAPAPSPAASPSAGPSSR